VTWPVGRCGQGRRADRGGHRWWSGVV